MKWSRPSYLTDSLFQISYWMIHIYVLTEMYFSHFWTLIQICQSREHDKLFSVSCFLDCWRFLCEIMFRRNFVYIYIHVVLVCLHVYVLEMCVTLGIIGCGGIEMQQSGLYWTAGFSNPWPRTMWIFSLKKTIKSQQSRWTEKHLYVDFLLLHAP